MMAGPMLGASPVLRAMVAVEVAIGAPDPGLETQEQKYQV